jgi:ATP synthase protein I
MQEENPNPSGKKRSETLDAVVKAERLTQIAVVLPAAVLVGWLLGALLDKWLHTQWIYIVGVVFGGIAGLTEAVRQAFRADREK